MSDPGKQLDQIEARWSGHLEPLSPEVQDIRWLVRHARKQAAVIQAARQALERRDPTYTDQEWDRVATDYDRAHRWTDEAEGREHLWCICQAIEALEADLDAQGNPAE